MIESHPTRYQREIDFTVEQWTAQGWTCVVIPHKGSDGGTFWTVKGIKTEQVERARTWLNDNGWGDALYMQPGSEVEMVEEWRRLAFA